MKDLVISGADGSRILVEVYRGEPSITVSFEESSTAVVLNADEALRVAEKLLRIVRKTEV